MVYYPQPSFQPFSDYSYGRVALQHQQADMFDPSFVAMHPSMVHEQHPLCYTIDANGNLVVVTAPQTLNASPTFSLNQSNASSNESFHRASIASTSDGTIASQPSEVKSSRSGKRSDGTSGGGMSRKSGGVSFYSCLGYKFINDCNFRNFALALALLTRPNSVICFLLKELAVMVRLACFFNCKCKTFFRSWMPICSRRRRTSNYGKFFSNVIIPCFTDITSFRLLIQSTKLNSVISSTLLEAVNMVKNVIFVIQQMLLPPLLLLLPMLIINLASMFLSF